MRRVLARAVAVLALVGGIAVSTTVPAQAAPAKPSSQPTTNKDWWF